VCARWSGASAYEKTIELTALKAQCSNSQNRGFDMSATQSLTFRNLEASVCRRPAIAQRKATAGGRSPYRLRAGSGEVSLIKRLKAGDSDALETIFNTHSTKLYNVAQRILGEASDTQEVIQYVLWSVFRKTQSFRGNSRFSTWLYRLTVNASLSKLRERKKNRVSCNMPSFRRRLGGGEK
jgi:Sigma-70 region 2